MSCKLARRPSGLKRVTLEPCADVPIERQRHEAAAVVDRIKQGKDPMPAPPEPDPTVVDLAEHYKRSHVAVCIPAALDNHILPALGAMPLKAVRTKDVDALHHGVRHTPCKVNQELTILSKMITLAEARELTPPGRNPCRSVRRFRAKSRERSLKPEEYRRVGAALKEVAVAGSMWPPAIVASRLLMLTGRRMNEILTLQWDDVDRTAGELRRRDSKSGLRMVPLTTPVLKVLDGIERIQGDPWVIRSRKRGRHLPGLSSYWSRIQALISIFSGYRSSSNWIVMDYS